MSVWLGLLRKELLEIRRDKRALLAGLGLAFLAPLIIYGGTSFVIKQASAEPRVWINIVHADAAPALVESLNEANIWDINTSEDPERPESAKLTLLIDPRFSEAIGSGTEAKLTLRGALYEDSVRPVLNRVRRVINEHASTTAGVRLLMRGMDPKLIRPIRTEEQNTAPAANNAGTLTMMIGIYVMMAAFVSAISSAVDTSAGERERHVLEILLIQPVSSLAIVTAKLTGVFLVAMLGVLLTLTFSAFAMSQVELEKIGMAFSMSPINFIAIIAAMVPLALLAGALNLLVAFFSRTFKEAQSQVTMIIMVPAIAPMVMVFTPDPPDVLRQLPVTGQYLFLEQVLKGESISASAPLLASVGTLVISGIIVWLTSRHLGSERSINAL